MKTMIRIYTVLVYVFLYLPIAVMILFSFNSINSTGVFGGFSLRWYRELFRDSETLNALKNSIIMALLSSLIATVVGTAAAVGIDKMRSRWLKSVTLTVTNIPMVNPEIVTGVSMMLLFVFASRLVRISGVLGFWTLLIAHVTFNLPYVILSVLPKLRQIDPHLQEAAQDLGCPPLKSFFLAVFPTIVPGVLTGAIMAFTLSLDDFVISYFTNGPEFQTLPIRIFSMTKKRVTPDIYSLSTMLFAAILLLLIIINVLQAQSEKQQSKKKYY
ncbi:MAG TPA: ABC transporter permease [Bacillota bacterium]|nr:ABC transporter permease [Bacillota bacterium]